MITDIGCVLLNIIYSTKKTSHQKYIKITINAKLKFSSCISSYTTPNKRQKATMGGPFKKSVKSVKN